MRLRALAAVAVVCAPSFLLPAEEPEKPKLKLGRITTPIKVDGDLSDPGWAEATEVPLIYEINPGDNVTPPVKTIARIGYDDEFFYASFWSEEPDVSKIRAPYVDRDGINDDQDYVGVLLDVENQNHSAIDFWIGPRGIQADSVFNEGTFTEDFGPDYFWQSAGKIGTDSWVAEVAIPLSSLRYPEKEPQDWALMLYRVWPRDRNYQFYNVRVPRGSSCFLCQSATIEGITGLSKGAHWVLAPYGAVTSTKTYAGSNGLRRRRHDDQGQGRPGREVAPGRRHDRRRDDQPRLLPDRVRHGADLRQRALRALLPGEAPVLPRARGSAADADPGGLHAHDHLAPLGRAGHRQDGRDELHRPRRQRPGRRDGHHPGTGVLGRRAPGLSSRPSRSCASARTSATPSPGSSGPRGPSTAPTAADTTTSWAATSTGRRARTTSSTGSTSTASRRTRTAPTCTPAGPGRSSRASAGRRRGPTRRGTGTGT